MTDDAINGLQAELHRLSELGYREPNQDREIDLRRFARRDALNVPSRRDIEEAQRQVAYAAERNRRMTARYPYPSNPWLCVISFSF